MNNDFFKEQLRLAEKKVSEQKKVEQAITESKANVLREFVIPIIDFLFFINENTSFNKKTHYSHDKTLLRDCTKEKLLDKVDSNTFLKINIVSVSSEYGGFDYIMIGIDSDYNCTITYSWNTTQTRKTFKDLQSFIEDFSVIVAKNKDQD
jgi:hypothetical protein